MELIINKKKKGKTTYFFPTINGKRINSTLYIRKYDAEALGKSALKHLQSKGIKIV